MQTPNSHVWFSSSAHYTKAPCPDQPSVSWTQWTPLPVPRSKAHRIPISPPTLLTRTEPKKSGVRRSGEEGRRTKIILKLLFWVPTIQYSLNDKDISYLVAVSWNLSPEGVPKGTNWEPLRLTKGKWWRCNAPSGWKAADQKWHHSWYTHTGPRVKKQNQAATVINCSGPHLITHIPGYNCSWRNKEVMKIEIKFTCSNNVIANFWWEMQCWAVHISSLVSSAMWKWILIRRFS